MQQFTVPQFIDVESQIIGPITTRQFIILLVAAIIIGLSYKLFDFSLFVTVAVVVLAIAATFAFVKINGRPFHLFVLNTIQTWRRPGLRVWNNQAVMSEHTEKTAAVTPSYQPAAPKVYKKSRLAELALIVDTKGRYKGE
ncbi:MAG: PrgI family protein [Patescibacteria group bacterium]